MPLGALGAIAGTVGGAAQGFAPALRDVMGMQQEEERFETQRADTQAYREQALAQDQQRTDQAAAAEARRVQDAERARALERRRMLHQQNVDEQRLEIDRMRERRLSEGTGGDERADRALNAAEAVAAFQARRPFFDPDNFGDYANYQKALEDYKEQELQIWKTFGFEGPEQAAQFMPGGSHLKPSNHRENRGTPLRQTPGTDSLYDLPMQYRGPGPPPQVSPGSPLQQFREIQGQGMSLPDAARRTRYRDLLGPGGG